MSAAWTHLSSTGLGLTASQDLQCSHWPQCKRLHYCQFSLPSSLRPIEHVSSFRLLHCYFLCAQLFRLTVTCGISQPTKNGTKQALVNIITVWRPRISEGWNLVYMPVVFGQYVNQEKSGIIFLILTPASNNESLRVLILN